MADLVESEMDIPYSFYGEPYKIFESQSNLNDLSLIDYKIFKEKNLVYDSQQDNFLQSNSILFYFLQLISPNYENTVQMKSLMVLTQPHLY